MNQKEALKNLRILYPIWMLLGMFSLMYVPSKLIVEDAGQTATNILANEMLFKSGIAGSLFTHLLFIFAVILLYHLFKSVSRTCSMNMLVFALVSVPIAMVATLGQVAALELASSDETLMMFFLHLSDQGIIIASIFWGLWLLPLGNLVRLSGYFPKFIGYALMVACAGYFLGSFAQILMERPETVMSIFELLTFGEMIFIFWLIIRGAKLPQTNEADLN